MATALLAFAGCGDDGESADEETAAETGAADLDRYCQLSSELDQAGEEFFGELEEQEDATREDFREAEREFLEQNEDRIDEVVAAAPPEIKDDAETFVEGLRARAGVSEGPVDREAVTAADQRLNEFEQENCPS